MAEKCTTIGGQAVIEGVMMRGKKIYALAVRNPEGEIVIEKKPVISMNKGLFKLPVFRGMAAFVDSLVNGTKILMRSAEIAGEGWEDEELSPFEQWLMDKFGDKVTDILIYFSVFLSLVLGMTLFFVNELYKKRAIAVDLFVKSSFLRELSPQVTEGCL